MAPYSNHFNMLQIISLLYMLITVTCARSSLSHDEECSALFQFKQSMIHQDDEALCSASWFQTFHSWKPTNNASIVGFDCCSWHGVECRNGDAYGHVIGLDLSESFLCGHINSNTTIFNLVHLQSLNLAMNNFHESQIPSEIARLKQLRSLNLSYCGFSGQIPIEISQMMQLSSLDLSRNPLQLHTPSMENLMQNLTRLEELDLSLVDISSSIPHFLVNFSSLRLLRLYNCSLRNEFPIAIFELPKLKILNVALNPNLIGYLPEFRNNNLLDLRLSRCSFSGRIPRSLSNLTQLTFLTLGGNKFTGFVPSLVGLSELNALELNGNNFEKGQLPDWLGKLTKLNLLYLSDNNLNGEIPSFLANLTKLSVLSLGLNSLNGHIPPSFFNLTQLTMLDLQGNQLEGPIPSSFSKFNGLRALRLNFNSFIGRVDLDIFLGLNKLEVLMLGGNKISLVPTDNYTISTLPQLKDLQLSSCNLKKFPGFLRFQNKMRTLVFDHNKIEGRVPVWIWNNSQETLQVISLSFNSITGFHQHPFFLKWERLEGFFIRNNHVGGQIPIPPQTIVFYDVSNNNMNGEIPPWLCEMKSLRRLDLSSNNMSGTLPSCFDSLSNSLVDLNLRGNKFRGTMMDAFMHGSMLESIDLSENRFMGQLPRSLTNCTNLEVLSLGDNSFHDVFPFWLGTLAKLQVLVLHSNKFYGPIQGTATVSSQFSNLRIIDLSNNSFSGQLDQNYFQTWNAMKSAYVGESSTLGIELNFEAGYSKSSYSMTIIHKGVRTNYEKILTIFMAIDLSCNHFEGEIPLSLQDLRGLQSLNLSNNHFSGGVLPSLGYLKNLESLDLSRNKLLGEIPQQLVELGFLSIFNVSFNNLEGRIPHGKQFDTFENNSYMGNSRLCGQPLSKECQDSKASQLPPTTRDTYESEFESLLPNERIDWIIVFCGVGSGLVVGVVIGNFLYTRYSHRFTKRKEIWVRPLRNTRRNQGVS